LSLAAAAVTELKQCEMDSVVPFAAVKEVSVISSVRLREHATVMFEPFTCFKCQNIH
jgi:hypothetical protein